MVQALIVTSMSSNAAPRWRRATRVEKLAASGIPEQDGAEKKKVREGIKANIEAVF